MTDSSTWQQRYPWYFGLAFWVLATYNTYLHHQHVIARHDYYMWKMNAGARLKERRY